MKKILVLLILLSSLLLTGCFDSKETDNMVYVIAIGLDEDESGLSYTFQYALPLNISKGSSGEGEPLECTKVQATNIYSAMDYFNTIISKEITLSHLKLIVFSKELAYSGLDRFKPDLLSNTEILPSACIVIAEESSYDYLDNVSSPLEINPARYYNFAFDEKNSPYSEAFYLKTFFEKEDYTIPSVFAKDGVSSTNGAYMFKDHKVCDFISGSEIPYLKMLTGTLNKFTLDFSSQGFSTVITQQKKPYISVDKENENVFITLYLSKESHGNIPNDAGTIINTRLINKCTNLIARSQRKNSDILNIKAAFRPNFSTLTDYQNYNITEKYPRIYFDVIIKNQ